MYEYNFPAVTAKASPAGQADKMNEELAEFRCASGLSSWSDGTQPFDPLDASACMAMLDVIHACETMLRMYDQGIVGPCRGVVEARNRARGCYEEPDWRARAEAELNAILTDAKYAEGGGR